MEKNPEAGLPSTELESGQPVSEAATIHETVTGIIIYAMQEKRTEKRERREHTGYDTRDWREGRERRMASMSSILCDGAGVVGPSSDASTVERSCFGDTIFC